MKTEADKRRLTILVSVGALLLVGLLAFNMMGDDESPSSTVQPGASKSTTKEKAPAAAPTPEDPVATVDVGLVRDPFEPPFTETPVTPGETSTTTTPSGNGSATTTPPDNSSPNPVEQNPAPANAVALIAITDVNGVKTAQVRVGITTYTVVAGDTFATSFKVLSLTDTCGQFLYGDSPFSLCVGEQVLK